MRRCALSSVGTRRRLQYSTGVDPRNGWGASGVRSALVLLIIGCRFGCACRRLGRDQQTAVEWCRERDTRRGMHEGIINKARDSVRRGPEARGRLEGKIRIEGLAVRRRRAPQPFLLGEHTCPTTIQPIQPPPGDVGNQRSPSPKLGGPVSVYEMAKWHHKQKGVASHMCDRSLANPHIDRAFPLPPTVTKC